MSVCRRDLENCSGASCAVHDYSYNQRKLNNVLLLHCFNHNPLLRKECSCGVHKMSGNTETKRQWLAALQIFHPLKNLFVLFPQQKLTDQNNEPDHLCFMCPTSLTWWHRKLSQKYQTPRQDLTWQRGRTAKLHVKHILVCRLFRKQTAWG